MIKIFFFFFISGKLYVVVRTIHKMTKCKDNAWWPASAANHNGVGVLWYNICGLGRLSIALPMQVEFREKNSIVQGVKFYKNTIITRCGHAST